MKSGRTKVCRNDEKYCLDISWDDRVDALAHVLLVCIAHRAVAPVDIAGRVADCELPGV